MISSTINKFHRTMDSVLCLRHCLMFIILGPFAVSVHAESFWAHRIVKLVDIPYGDHPRQVMDAFVQGERIGEPKYFAADTDKRPTLMWIHGGGWVAGDKASNFSNVVPYLQFGWNVYSINYRLGANTAPQAIDDVMCAYKSLSERLANIGQDPKDIVVSGASAGGHLALVIGLLNSQEKISHKCKVPQAPRAVINWYGITDIEQIDGYLEESRPDRNYARTWAGNRAKVARISDRYSPIYLLSADAPPIFTIHGTEDSVVPFEQAETFHASLDSPNELMPVQEGTHGGFSDKQYKAAYFRIFQFLDLNR